MEKQRAQSRPRAELAEAGAAGRHQRRPRRHRPRRRPARRRPPTRRQPAGRAAAPVVSRDAAIAATPARQDRDAAAYRQHFAEGRAHRRPVAGASSATPSIRSRPRSCCISPSNTAQSLLRRVRLGRRRGLDGANSRPGHGVAAGRLGQPVAEQPGDAEIRQWRRPHLPPHHCDRRPLSLHHQGRRHQCRQCAGHALSVRADLAPRHARRSRATTSCTKA